ncbi:MAG TPA: putative glycolipid-binding domain-containing protein [Terriglobales bacterium]|nr:putative glycolipid-binding domain-containing protein [Terriglobales bacterium]
MAETLKRVVVWKNLLFKGTDYCALWHTAEGWLLKGTVVGVVKDQQPMLANYEIYCDENWFTHRVQVERTSGSDVKTLSLSVESRGVWRSAGQELPSVRGCDDVDLAVTPATNTLPIRRLNLQVGGSESVIAAWVKFPDLTLRPLSQRYSRLTKDTYRYESNTGFSAEIVVDDLGLVTTYAGGWERIAAL